MGPSEDLSSSPAPKSASLEEELAYYKAQYEQLEAELQDFQASSRELEAELEKDIETAEKRERELQEKVDSLGFEVDEWKVSHMLNIKFSLSLTSMVDKVQAIQNRSKQRPKYSTKRDHESPRFEPDTPTEIKRYRSRE